MGSTYIKDLRIIANRDLREVLLVDNSALCFALQLDNGVPILPFYWNKSDDELLHLLYYLQCVASADDVRVHNREAFQLRALSEAHHEDRLDTSPVRHYSSISSDYEFDSAPLEPKMGASRNKQENPRLGMV